PAPAQPALPVPAPAQPAPAPAALGAGRRRDPSKPARGHQMRPTLLPIRHFRFWHCRPIGAMPAPAPRVSYGLPLTADLRTQREPKPAGFSVRGVHTTHPPPSQPERNAQQNNGEAMEPGESGMEDPAETNEATGDQETDARATIQQAQEPQGM
ncbi:hypothetical protein THAOC_33415, partial [Thalassiosira oceanica]